MRELKPVDLCTPGKIKRVRGIAYTSRCSPQHGNRIVASSRALLNKFIPDVYVYTDHYKGNDCGPSPGYGVSLVAESTTGVLHVGESDGNGGSVAEDVGREASRALFDDVAHGGCVAREMQWVVFLFMVLCPEDVSRVLVGDGIADYSVEMLRHIRDFFGVTFKVKRELAKGSGSSDGGVEKSRVVCSCMGVGYKNMSKKVA